MRRRGVGDVDNNRSLYGRCLKTTIRKKGELEFWSKSTTSCLPGWHLCSAYSYIALAPGTRVYDEPTVLHSIPHSNMFVNGLIKHRYNTLHSTVNIHNHWAVYSLYAHVVAVNSTLALYQSILIGSNERTNTLTFGISNFNSGIPTSRHPSINEHNARRCSIGPTQ